MKIIMIILLSDLYKMVYFIDIGYTMYNNLIHILCANMIYLNLLI